MGAQSAAQYFADFQLLPFIWGALTLSQPIIPAVFEGQPYSFVNGAMWTIPVEFSCYLGVLAMGILSGFKRPVCLVFMALFIAASLVQHGGYRPAWLTPFHPGLAACFSVGSCFYIFKDRIRLTPRYAMLAGIALFVGLFSYRWHQLVFSLAGAYLLFFFAFAKVPPLANFDRLPDVSYGLYLYGWPIQKRIIWWFPAISPWVLFFVSACAAAAAGWASWHLIEKRFARSGRKAVARSSAPPDQAMMRE